MSMKIIITTTLIGLMASTAAMADDGKNKRKKGQRGHMIEKLDTDKSGTISMEEFASVGLGKMLGADTNGDGNLSMEEIEAQIDKNRKKRREEALKKRLDMDGDGTITIAEIKAQHDKQFAVLDRNSDGVLSKDELRKIRKKRKGNRR